MNQKHPKPLNENNIVYHDSSKIESSRIIEKMASEDPQAKITYLYSKSDKRK
jgi:hypothetical protein